MEPDDVVIADIGGQALDIFLHGPESAHKNGIVKTFTHTSIPIHPFVLLKETKSKILNLLNMILYLCSSCPMWWESTARKLGRCSSGLLHDGNLLA